MVWAGQMFEGPPGRAEGGLVVPESEEVQWGGDGMESRGQQAQVEGCWEGSQGCPGGWRCRSLGSGSQVRALQVELGWGFHRECPPEALGAIAEGPCQWGVSEAAGHIRLCLGIVVLEQG